MARVIKTHAGLTSDIISRKLARQDKGGKQPATDPPLPGSRLGPLPNRVAPMLPTLIEAPFSDQTWIYETKWDGYRAICFIADDDYRLVSRNQLDMTDQYPELAALPDLVKAETAVLDGEIVAIGPNGLPSFQLMQSGRGNRVRIVYYLFDVIHYNGYDVTQCKVQERKDLLRKILTTTDVVRYSDHIESEGVALFEMAAVAGIEGIVAKKKDSLYTEGRTTQWLKIKTTRSADVVVCGYTDPKNTRAYFGGLILGLYDGSALVYAGRVGGGFNKQTLKQGFDLIQPLAVDECRLGTKPGGRDIHWVRPEIVVAVKFSEWTREGLMRHPVFLGVRSEKGPAECTIEQVRNIGRIRDE